nr:immunoglobulin light chain junction region [Macaca mulatta]
CQRAYSYPLTF